MMRNINQKDWLSVKLGVDYPTAYEKLHVYMILWMLCEREIVRCSPSNLITSKIEDVSQTMKVDVEVLNKTLVSLSSINGGKIGKQRLREIRIMEPRLQKYQRILENYKIATQQEKVEVALMIIYKYRCRFFHCNKDLSTIHESQEDRLDCFNEFMISCLEKN